MATRDTPNELGLFHVCPIIYPTGTVYYYTGHPSNSISLVALKCYVVFQKVTYKPLKYCDFLDPDEELLP